MRWLVWCPVRLSSAASCRTLLQVHRSGDSGSPRVNRFHQSLQVALQCRILLDSPLSSCSLEPDSLTAHIAVGPSLARRFRESLFLAPDHWPARPPLLLQTPGPPQSAAATSRRVRSSRTRARIPNFRAKPSPSGIRCQYKTSQQQIVPFIL